MFERARSVAVSNTRSELFVTDRRSTDIIVLHSTSLDYCLCCCALAVAVNDICFVFAFLLRCCNRLAASFAPLVVC